MKSIEDMTSWELAAFIQNHLKRKGIDVILSGGACVSFYSNNKYVSMDLDLINIYLAKRRNIREAMLEIGFIEEGRYFKHPNTQFFVELPPGPLAVGAEPVKNIDEYELATGILRIISTTDCVKDRLAAYYHWKDLQCLEQACLVAMHSKIDLEEVENWSKNEGKEKEFRHFEDKLTS
jgi:hypothetical protein